MDAIKIITHNGGFHADDVFACATVALYLDSLSKPYTIIRTRDSASIFSGDIVLDVGGVYDEERDRFDHHQAETAGKHANGILYASFGLVWKKYGPLLCTSDVAVQEIEKLLIEPIDAFDNGVAIHTSIYSDVWPVTIHTIIGMYNARWNEDEAVNHENFLLLVDFAKQFIARSILSVQTQKDIDIDAKNKYEQLDNPALLVFDEPYGRIPIQIACQTLTSAKIAVFPHITKERWHVLTLVDDIHSFASRIQLPLEWAGQKGEELQTITGVASAQFCHNARFLAVAGTKEDAIVLATNALSVS